MKLLNAFSLSMIENHNHTILKTEDVEIELVHYIFQEEGMESCVGHESTASLFSNLLGLEVQTNRVSVVIEPGETVIVGQYSGPRLQEGATCLPEGATIKWIAVTLFKEGDLEEEYLTRKKTNFPV